VLFLTQSTPKVLGWFSGQYMVVLLFERGFEKSILRSISPDESLPDNSLSELFSPEKNFAVLFFAQLFGLKTILVTNFPAKNYLAKNYPTNNYPGANFSAKKSLGTNL
jgi:hypothetical protein